MKRSSLVVAAVLATAVSLSPAPAAAQSEPTVVAVALFQQGRELIKQGRYSEACPKLAESQRLEPKLGTLLNLALCNEKLGKIATAWAEYTSAAALARREKEKEREDFAREQVAALEKRMPRVVLQVTAPEPGLRITLDDQIMADAVMGTPLPIDPGKHRISAVAPGKKAWSRDLDVPFEKTDVPVSVPALEAAPAEPPPTPPPVAPAPGPVVVPPPVAPLPPPATRPPPPASGPSTSGLLIGIGFGVGGAGVLVGSLTGAITLVNAGNIRGQCPLNQCKPDQQSAIDSATTLANVSNVSFGIGAAGIVAGVVGLIMRPGAPAPAAGAASTGVRITPFAGPGIAGVRGTF